jgi:DNA-binding Xre family transcriptional regulator
MRADMVELLAMAVRFAVKEIAQARGYKNARRLAEAARVALGTMYAIWDNKKQYVHLKVLERLAATLDVPVGMLLTEQQPPADARARVASEKSAEGDSRSPAPAVKTGRARRSRKRGHL